MPSKFETKFGTTKVQMDADSAEGADSAEPQDCSFPKKIKNPGKTAKNNVSPKSPPSAPNKKFKHCE